LSASTRLSHLSVTDIGTRRPTALMSHGRPPSGSARRGEGKPLRRSRTRPGSFERLLRGGRVPFRSRFRFCAARGALHAARALPRGECRGVFGELVADDCVELSHDGDAASNRSLDGGRGLYARAVALVLARDALL